MPLLLDTARFGSPSELLGSNCLTIGFVNNMPDTAVGATERQFIDLIRAASSDAVVRLKLFAISGVPRSELAQSELTERYHDISELWDTRLDGRLAQAIVSMQAVKGVEIGFAAEGAASFGSKVQDSIHYDREARRFTRGATRGLRKPVSSHIEPVSGIPKRKLENGEQRLAAQSRQSKAESPEFAGQRLGRASITRGNVGSSRTAGIK